VAEEEVVVELGLSDTLPWQRSDTLWIGEVRLASGGLAHSERRKREENERPLDMRYGGVEGKEKNSNMYPKVRVLMVQKRMSLEQLEPTKG
jgi:hypothetical protein